MSKMTQAEVIKACPQCPKCDGKPAIKYEPGCLYTWCIFKHPDCPMTKAVPDYDPEAMVRELKKVRKDDFRR